MTESLTVSTFQHPHDGRWNATIYGADGFALGAALSCETRHAALVAAGEKAGWSWFESMTVPERFSHESQLASRGHHWLSLWPDVLAGHLEVLAVAREISPHDPPFRTIDRLTARERVELVSVLRSARLMSCSFGLDRGVYSGFILSRGR